MKALYNVYSMKVQLTQKLYYMLISRQFYLLILTLTLSSFVYSQNFLDVNNVTRYGNFDCGADPTITAEVISSEGSSVVDGALVITTHVDLQLFTYLCKTLDIINQEPTGLMDSFSQKVKVFQLHL